MAYKHALAPYLKSPESHDAVLCYNDDYVVVADQFPKSEFHYLLCPRDLVQSKQSPLSLEITEPGLALLEKTQQTIIGRYKEKFGHEIDESFILVGCHAVPSLLNLHIHIITKDFHSERLKNTAHYNSFNTEFFVPLGDLPLSKSDPRRNTARMEKLKKKNLYCPYCGEDYRNKFADFKHHLDDEFQEF